MIQQNFSFQIWLLLFYQTKFCCVFGGKTFPPYLIYGAGSSQGSYRSAYLSQRSALVPTSFICTAILTLTTGPLCYRESVLCPSYSKAFFDKMHWIGCQWQESMNPLSFPLSFLKATWMKHAVNVARNSERLYHAVRSQTLPSVLLLYSDHLLTSEGEATT